MKRPRRPKYWQLDLFVCAMIALSIMIMQFHIAPQWESLVDTGWAALAIVGMTVWVWANWPALHDEERRERQRLKDEQAEPNQFEALTPPLTPVQRHFLDTMRRYGRQ